MKGSTITKEEAVAIANKLGEMRFHLVVSGLSFEEYTELNAAFVEGRKPRRVNGSLE